MELASPMDDFVKNELGEVADFVVYIAVVDFFFMAEIECLGPLYKNIVWLREQPSHETQNVASSNA